MLTMKKIASICALLCISTVGFTAPTFLMTHNRTDFESNAYIDGTPSIYPTKAHTDNKVYWNMVKVACHGHSTGNLCTALIKVATNTANPIAIGYVTLDLVTGDITPKVLSAEGFTVVINGPGETTITH